MIMARTSLLLALPAELRKLIYFFVASESNFLRVKSRQTRAYKDPVRKERFISTSGLISTCREVRAEYYGALQEHAFTTADALVFNIVNLDFRPIEIFVKSLTDEDSCKLTASAPVYVARLDITDERTLSDTKLGRWLKFRKTAKFDVLYEVGRVVSEEVPVRFFIGLDDALSGIPDFDYMSVMFWEWAEAKKEAALKDVSNSTGFTQEEVADGESADAG